MAFGISLTSVAPFESFARQRSPSTRTAHAALSTERHSSGCADRYAMTPAIHCWMCAVDITPPCNRFSFFAIDSGTTCRTLSTSSWRKPCSSAFGRHFFATHCVGVADRHAASANDQRARHHGAQIAIHLSKVDGALPRVSHFDTRCGAVECKRKA